MYDIKINVWNNNIINIIEGNGFKVIQLNVIEIYILKYYNKQEVEYPSTLLEIFLNPNNSLPLMN